MPERENVIRELKAARLFFEMGSNRADGVVGNLGCKSGMKYIDDAIALLKGKEAKIVESIQMDRSDKWGADLTGYCPSCKRSLKSRYNNRFCGECGQAVKWGD